MELLASRGIVVFIGIGDEDKLSGGGCWQRSCLGALVIWQFRLGGLRRSECPEC